ncbi:putative flavin-containing amine oxidase [Aspergillus japonicus CBS 114.51]|uniref:Amine oxidase n=1 Tax=Aspergillus japonicus CBS 114.51 TaxID=1448312 RepID=A0A8T8X071_ASPJA|nr:putative flavin-containing amine oxidase [Aspergillus japonicus CBS 114.51]RAH81528.1 putative flavin-containing amine oxidase [Aspergillus japonicus CBS 114.51]
MSKVQTVDLSNTTGAYYAPATISPAGQMIHVTGQPGTTKDGVAPPDYESQIHLALLNLRKIIIAAGSAVRHIVKLNLFIVNYDAANRKHTRHVERFLEGHRPAITVVPVPKLAAPSWLFEIDAVLALPDPALPPVLGAVHESVDVIVIGAGLAGLSAAHDVLRAGVSCIVLEARDRVGGKTWSTPLADGRGTIDLGAAWINDTNQSKVYGLAQRYGVDLIVQNTEGDAVLQDVDGTCTPFRYGELPNFPPETQAHLAAIRDLCEADCQALDAWRPRDPALDRVTFEAYLRARGASEVAVATARVWTRAMLGQDPNDVSALYFLNYCKAGGGLLQMRSDRKHGGQYLRVRQGTQAFALGLAASLPRDTVRLAQPVHSIVQTAHQPVKVQAGGAVYAARKVILTVPTPAMKKIAFFPALPPAKQAWIESTTYGYYTKAMVEFRSPFWVRGGFCGLAQSFSGPASVVRDSCSPDDAKYVLTCFMSGEPGRAWAALPVPEQERQLLDQLAKLFQVARGNVDDEFVQMTKYEWAQDEWSGWGCPCTSLTPGVLDTLGPDALRESCGDLHFAGTETAGEWKGYMEGAIRSGERAASEVVKALQAGVTARL